MENPLPKGSPRKDPEIAAAEWLFQDSPAPASPQPAARQIVPGSGGEFELTDLPEQIEPVPLAVDPLAEPATAPARPRFAPPPPPPVEQVWSRTAEWGPTLLVLAAWCAVILGLVYWSLSDELYQMAVLLFLVGAVGAVVLSYPILITLERPVRITPEQAARDFYGALSHHVPHFRRMWLLLSDRGRTGPFFASYDGFKSYWIKRLAQLKAGRTGRFSPLVFQVEDFQAEKSAGKTSMNAQFKVNVFIRGRRNEGAVASFPVAAGFARGPDSMWYLEDGTLETPAAARSRPA
jgi:hypothetical protein